MLNYIEYSVTFGTTGRTLAEKINFRTGFGTITGPNEAGKSFVIEMVRWAMFGSQALRGTAAELKKAKATLGLTVKGQPYKIERTPNNAKMFKGDTEIAVGTKPVNSKIVEVLGFGLAVFDVACVANQGEIEALVAMKPTERKKLVDNVIGLGVIDDLAKIAGDEASTLRRLASDLSERAVEPKTPTPPEGHRPLAEIDAELARMSAAKTELATISGWLQNRPTEPVRPSTTINMGSAILAELAQNQIHKRSDLRHAEMELNSLPTASPYSEEQLAEIEAAWAAHLNWREKDQLERSVKEPLHSLPQLDDLETSLTENMRWEEAQRLSRKIAELEAHGSHTCPACTHSWAVEADAIGQLKERLALVEDAYYSKCMYTLDDVKRMREQVYLWLKVQQRLASEFGSITEVPRPALTEADIESHRNRHKFTARRIELEANVATLKAALEDQPDFDRMHRDRLRYEDQFADYVEKLEAYEKWHAEAEQKIARVAILKAEVEGFDELNNLRMAVAAYEWQLGRYAEDLKAYTDTMVQVQETRDSIEQWEKAKVALTTLRGLVKQHLMPSLNKVASFYLQQMTGGQRQVVHTDEDFNITVDGQALNTLSGSGKAVACLALRLGLGQVLTNNIFSVFVGDEIDASMDKDRAENTALTLQTLKDRISQILLITHKFPSADYYITVGNTHGTAPGLS